MRILRSVAWGLALVAILGCNRSGLNLAPVEGVVIFKGAPVADAGVLFKPDEGPYAMGTTDEAGRFSLVTANHEGALVGNHRVAITKFETVVRHIPGNPFPVHDMKPLIPVKYFDASTSGLSATVSDDDNQLQFDLTVN
jgi:hypothetical protein